MFVTHQRKNFLVRRYKTRGIEPKKKSDPMSIYMIEEWRPCPVTWRLRGLKRRNVPEEDKPAAADFSR
jgi:hypothetical protein